MIENRQCRHCGETLPISSFRPTSPTTHRHVCRDCARAHNRDYSREYMRKKRQEQKELAAMLGLDRQPSRVDPSPTATRLDRIEEKIDLLAKQIEAIYNSTHS